MESRALVDNEALFKELKKKPDVAWPTVTLMLVCHAVIITSWYLCLTDQMALGWGMIINGIAMYYLFSPIHDSMHQAVFKKNKYNDIFLFVAVFPIIPLATGQFLRMMHMQHHRFTNDEHDPDHQHGRDWKQMLTTWFTWELVYMRKYKEKKGTIYPELDAGLMRYETYIVWAAVIPLFFFIPVEMIFLWLIPSRIMTWLVCAVFMYLPHIPHNIKQKDDPFKATLIRSGMEWLITPLMACQNYHLVHHLYPTVPFYRYKKVWESKFNYHNAQNPGIVDTFHLKPHYGAAVEEQGNETVVPLKKTA